MSIRSLQTFEDEIASRLSISPTGSTSITSQEDFLVEDSPPPTGELQVLYDDSRPRSEETVRTRTNNLPSYPSGNFGSYAGDDPARPIPRESLNKPVQKQPKYKYVVMPNSLMGIKLKEGESFVGNLLTSGLTGAGFGGVFGGVGSLIGAGAGLISGIFGGRDKTLWFDVVYKDALQDAFQNMGLKITDKPFGGNSLTVKSQFGIDSKVSIEDMVNVLNQFNQRLAQEFRNKPQIVNGLANVRIQDNYDKTHTAFRFAVQYPEPKKPEPEQSKVTSGNGKAVKGAVGAGALIGLISLLR